MVKTFVNVCGINMKFYITLCLLISGCGNGLCNNIITSESSSVDGKHTATIFVRNCGATTPYITVVSMRGADTKLDMNDYKDWLFTAHDKAVVELKWVSNDSLLVNYSSTDEEVTQQIAWKDLHISYIKNE